MLWPYAERHPGEYLRRAFLEPLGLSASDLARGLGVPRSRVSELLSGRRGITADTALRLGRYFRMDPSDWLALQACYDLSECDEPEIEPLDAPGFLIGPSGAFRLPREQPRARPDTRVDADLLARLRASAAQLPDRGETR